MLVVLDEAANIAPLRNLGTLATTAAGTGVQLVTVWHSHSQLRARYGADTGDAVAADHPVLLSLPGQRDAETLAALGGLTDGPVDGLTGRGRARWRAVPDRHAVLVSGDGAPELVDLDRDPRPGTARVRTPVEEAVGMYL